MHGHGGDLAPDLVADDAVYEIWRSVTGRELHSDARQKFAAQVAALHLAEVDRPELVAAAQRVFTVFGVLLLTDWREEVDEPGLAGLRAVSGEWEGNTDSAVLTLQAEIAGGSERRSTVPIIARSQNPALTRTVHFLRPPR
jgi:hypothetical protein